MAETSALAAALVALAGCASSAWRPFQAERVKLDVPFYAGDAARGGPAALAELLTFWDMPTEPKALEREISGSRPVGAMPADLLLAAEERGLQARSFQSMPQDVKEQLKLGHPVLAYLSLGFSLRPADRFVVITGFDDGRGGFFVHSSRDAHCFVPYGSFMSRWQKTGRWAIIILPAGEPVALERSAGAL